MTEHNEHRIVSSSPATLSVDTPFLNRAAWARILPFGTYILFIVLGDLLARAGVERADLRWLYPVQIGAVLVLLAVFWRKYDELRSFSLTFRQTAAAIVAGVIVLALWVNLTAAWMIIGNAAGYDPRTNGEIDWLLVSIRIAGAALVVPVMEELFWRSFVLRWVEASEFELVDPARVGLKAIVISVLLFGVEHNLWLAGVVAGLAYTLLYMWHRNLWSPVLAHAVTNGLLGVWVVATGSWTFW